MKKPLTVFIVIAILFCLCSCDKKPEKTSDAMYQIGINVLEAADEYINGKLSSKEIDQKLEDLNEQAKKQYEADLKTANSDTLVDTDISNDYFIQSGITLLYINSQFAMSDFIEQRDDLAKRLGK